MPPLPDVPNVIRVDMNTSWDDDPHLGNRSFWKWSGGAPSNTDLDTLSASVATAWNTLFGPLANTSVSLVEVVSTDLTAPTASRGTWLGSHVGTRSGTHLSRNDAALINFGIARRYRGGKPRVYMPLGVAADLTTSAEWTTAFQNAVTTAWEDLQITMGATVVGTTDIGSQVNVSYYQGFDSFQNPVTLRWRNVPTPRRAALEDVVTSALCNPLVGSQRRRVRA